LPAPETLNFASRTLPNIFASTGEYRQGNKVLTNHTDIGTNDKGTGFLKS
jgi:hypothetical protein